MVQEESVLGAYDLFDRVLWSDIIGSSIVVSFVLVRHVSLKHAYCHYYEYVI